MIELTELELKFTKDSRYVIDYKGYNYSIYKIESPLPQDKYDLTSRGIIEIKDDDILDLYRMYPLSADKAFYRIHHYYSDSDMRPCIISAIVCVDGRHYELSPLK